MDNIENRKVHEIRNCPYHDEIARKLCTVLLKKSLAYYADNSKLILVDC